MVPKFDKASGHPSCNKNPAFGDMKWAFPPTNACAAVSCVPTTKLASRGILGIQIFNF